MAGHAFSQVDVFASTAYSGNPVAVVHAADDVSDGEMTDFARWTNLSETTFLLQPVHPDADYRLRIFTPGGELPFAGHPTLGSCHAWLVAGGVPQRPDAIVQECAAGLINLCRIDDHLAFAAPPRVRTGPIDEALLGRIVKACGLTRGEILDHQWVDNGPGWCAVLLDSAQRVLSLSPDFSQLRGVALGVVGAHAPGAAADFEVRAFVPSLGVPEDPVTGSLNASIAQWLIESGVAPPAYRASQGAKVGRAGVVHLLERGEDLWVSGATSLQISGSVLLGA